MEAWSWLKSSFKWLAAIASVILATCFYFGFCWRNKLGLNPCGLPTLDLAPNLESESELLLLAECAIPARKISFEEVHQLDECWTMQLALAHAACAKKHDMLRDLYYSFEVAVIIGAIIIVLWLCCYIELLPYTILRLAYTYLENLGIITFFEAGLKKAAAGLLFGVAVCVLVHCTLMPALVLHMNLKYLCDQLLKEQKDFYKALQEAAIFQVYERTFTCELLPHYILFARAAWGQAVWSVVAAPLIPVIWEACKKLMQQEREWRKHQERYSRLINFSLNMVVENQEQEKHHSKRRRPMRTFMFRTFCELPTKDLIHNTALRASLKEAAQCTEGQFPLLHVLTPPAIEDLNRMCLNTISQRIGTTFFAMDQSPSGFPQDATCGDYCFALTSECYVDIKGNLSHENKVRCMVVQKKVLENINCTEDFDPSELSRIVEHANLSVTYDGGTLEMEEGIKSKQRWMTMRAMARAWKHRPVGLTCSPGQEFQGLVWSVNVPNFNQLFGT